jgi:3-oxoacyl-[acyl-carrier-protein] synthase II
VRRVVITDMSLITPLGRDVREVLDRMIEGRSGISRIDEWNSIPHMETRVAGAVGEVTGETIPRKIRKSMSRISLMAAETALEIARGANLTREDLASGRIGVSYGSTMGGVAELDDFYKEYFAGHGLAGMSSNTFLRIMSHTCAANVALALGVSGRIICSCSACTSASQSIGFGFESILDGHADAMFCGGAEELHFITAGVFDRLMTASVKFNNDPHRTPRPFDTRRDGVVCSEGAGTVLLEDYDRARKRGARIHAEVLGFATNCDGTHMTSPSKLGMREATRLALDQAGLDPRSVDYINAHATGTGTGDIAEAGMIHEIYGDGIPVSSSKGHLGHTLGACGAIEAILCVEMMHRGEIHQTLNLETIDEECGGILHVPRPLKKKLTHVVSNNFAFGGINSVLVLKKWSE